MEFETYWSESCRVRWEVSSIADVRAFEEEESLEKEDKFLRVSVDCLLESTALLFTRAVHFKTTQAKILFFERPM